MHDIKNKKFYLSPKMGTLINNRWITISELLHAYLPVLTRTHRWRQQHQPALPYLDGEARDHYNLAEAYQANLSWDRAGTLLYTNGEDPIGSAVR
jgi:hypothetical protein